MMMMIPPSTSAATPRVVAASIETTLHHGATTSAVGPFPLESTHYARMTHYVARLDRDGGVRARVCTWLIEKRWAVVVSCTQSRRVFDGFKN